MTGIRFLLISLITFIYSSCLLILKFKCCFTNWLNFYEYVYITLTHKVFLRNDLKNPLTYHISKRSWPFLNIESLYRNGQDSSVIQYNGRHEEYSCRTCRAPIYRGRGRSVLKYNMIQQIARIGYKYLFIILESKPNSNTGNKTYPFINSTEKEWRVIYAIFHINRTNWPYEAKQS